jgi:drug/metabolite transporter (DMT)-like permease
MRDPSPTSPTRPGDASAAVAAVATVTPAPHGPTTGVRYDRLDTFAISVMLSLCVVMGIGQVAIKVANEAISPLLQAGLRSMAAAMLLALWCRWRGISMRLAPGTLGPALLASVFFALEFAFLYPGLALTSASRAVVLLYTSPFFVALGAHFLIPGDRLTASKLAGLAAAFIGVAAVLAGREDAGRGALAGDLLCLAGGIAWAGITLTVRSSGLATAPAERVVLVQHIFTGVVLVAASRLLGEVGFSGPTWLHWGAFAWTTVLVAFVAFTTSYWLMMSYPASRIMAFMLPTPVFGVLAGHLLLGETLGPSLVAGLILLMLGLWLVNRPTRARSSSID